MFKNHPKGLPVLFFTEMWERFGFYLMLGIFVLYMTDQNPAKSGLGMDEASASDIYGTYLALVYLTPFVGGLLADRVLGYRKSIVIGGILMGLGYLGLAIPVGQGGSMTPFWLSLLLIIIGNGFFKPNISTLVGNLYSKEQYKPFKDAGFSIFYMGINVGAFVCNFVAAYLRNTYDWGYAFAAAGIGMFVGLIWFMLGQKHTAEADVLRPAREGDIPTGKILGLVFIPAAIFGAIGWFLPGLVGMENFIGSKSNDAFLFACIPVTFYYVSLWARAPQDEKGPIGALLSIMGVVVVFWAVFHQNGSALTIWARDYTEREIPAAVSGPAKSLGMVEEVDLSPRAIEERDLHGVPVLDAEGKKKTKMGPDPYFDNLPKAMWPTEKTGPEAKAPGLRLISTELFQSINPFCIIWLTPLVVGAFAWMRRRGSEPSTPGKISLGLFITGLSTLVMVAAVFAGDNGAVKISGWWLVSSYIVITVGELCLSPMGLSLVSKLSPPRITALMMGGWFLSTSIGNKLSGLLAGLWGTYENKATFFLINFAACVVAAGAIFLMLPRLKAVMKQHLGE
ncbi:MAG TPA: peptide MFS transporter [Nannocystaceae bacterium]|nr:peptide MFS transporter [Nannocystaceae bacterium]